MELTDEAVVLYCVAEDLLEGWGWESGWGWRVLKGEGLWGSG